MFRAICEEAFPQAVWEIKDRSNALPQVTRFVEQATMFLTLVGLTALVVAGVGAGQAVEAFLERRRATIATLKAMGAQGREIFLIYLLQIMAVAALGLVLGLALGAALPFAVEHFFGSRHSGAGALRGLCRTARAGRRLRHAGRARLRHSPAGARPRNRAGGSVPRSRRAVVAARDAGPIGPPQSRRLRSSPRCRSCCRPIPGSTWASSAARSACWWSLRSAGGHLAPWARAPSPPAFANAAPGPSPISRGPARRPPASSWRSGSG